MGGEPAWQGCGLGLECPPHGPELGTLRLVWREASPSPSCPPATAKKSAGRRQERGTEGSWRLTGGGTQRKEKGRGRGRGAYANGVPTPGL